MTPEQVHVALGQYVDTLALQHDQSAEMRPHYEIAIICPDCGKQTAFKGTCPKCGGKSWLPAGEWGGYLARRRTHFAIIEMQKLAAV